MKIIDKKKDYYDYLMGIYGMDEKIVYDRRDSITYDYFCRNRFISDDEMKTLSAITVRLGNLQYNIEKNKEGKWSLPEIIKVGPWWNCVEKPNPRRLSNVEMKNKNNPISVTFKVNHRGYRNGIRQDFSYYTVENPILSSFPAISGFISPETIWEEVYNFISSQYDKPIVDSRTEKQKIESAGFDSKISFRNM